MALPTIPQPAAAPWLPQVWWRLGRMLRYGIATLACLVITGSAALLGLFIVDPNGSEEFTVSRRPTLYNAVFDSAEREFPDSIYEEVIGSAHNSGGRIEATLEAILFGADVIETDVVQVGDTLYSGHTPPIPFIGPRFFRGPTLEEVWTASYRAGAFKLDLKETSPGYVALVAEFLESRPPTRDVIVASRSPQVLATLHERAPEAILLLSVSTEEAFADLQADEALQATIDGVTVRESLIDFGMVSWLDERGIGIFAWTVNDIGRVNDLIRLGVDGITTDNLAILSLLGGLPSGG